MIRTLYTYPGPVDFGLLVTELRAADPTVIDANDVGGEVAVYTPGTPDAAALGAVVAAHTPPAFPPLDPLGRMATLSAILHADVEDWANASGIPAEHLVHEAEAWSLGA